MDESKQEVLSRETAIPERVTPTGRKLGVVAMRGTHLYKIVFVDEKPGSVPDKYSGLYTSLHNANKALTEYVTSFWDTSDNATSPKKKTLSLNNSDAVSR